MFRFIPIIFVLFFNGCSSSTPLVYQREDKESRTKLFDLFCFEKKTKTQICINPNADSDPTGFISISVKH